jgi:DNA-3-methyladenine glycosylase I
MIEDRVRCFGEGDPLMAAYHDEEWGVPVHNDKTLFEFLILEGFQAGLSWRIILNKRKNFRRAFNGFDAKKIAKYTEEDIERLLSDAGIIRNRLKIEATITNAQAFLEIQESFGSFDQYIWRFTNDQTLKGPGAMCWEEVPSSSPESDAMSKDLKAHGFKFVGTTICYAFMQAVGMVDDHLVGCFRYRR